MLRKLTALFLTLVLAFTLAIPSLAEGIITIGAELGPDLSTTEGLAELVSAIQFQYANLGNSGSKLGILVSGTELVDLECSLNEDGLYATSSLINDQTYALTWEKLDALLDEYDIDLDDYKSLILSGQTEKLFATTSWDDTVNNASQISPEMGTWLSEILDHSVVETGNYTQDGVRDVANTRTTFNFTKEDMIAFLQIEDIEEIVDLDDDEIEKVRELINSADTELNAVGTSFLADGQLVGFDLQLVFNYQETSLASMTVKVDRLTTEAGMNYHAEISIGGETVEGALEVTSDALIRDGAIAEGTVLALVGDYQFSLLLSSAQNGTATDYALQVYYRQNAVSLLPIAASDVPLLTLKVNFNTDISGVSSKIDAAKAIEVMSMTETDLSELSSTAETNLYSLLFTAISLLPEKALTLVNSLLGMQ